MGYLRKIERYFNNNERVYFVIFNIIFFIYAFLSLITNEIAVPARFIIDNYDFDEFWYNFGSWLKDLTLPYNGPYGYDYPILSVYLCGLPFLFSDDIVFYYVFMKAFLIIVTYVDFRLLFLFILDIHQNNPQIKRTRLNITLLFVMPMILYLFFCRFESVLLLFMILSFKKLKSENYGGSMVFFALAFWIKQIVIMFLPIYISFIYYKQTSRSKNGSHKPENSQVCIYSVYHEIKTRIELIIKPFVVFVLTSLILILPNLIGGNVNAIFLNYIFQLNRGSNHEGYGALFEYLFGIEESEPIEILGIPISYPVLLVVQFSIFFVAFFIKIESFDDFLKATGFISIWFIIFSKFQSPQWLLWFIFYIYLSSLPLQHFKSIVTLTFSWGLLNYLIFMSTIGSIYWCLFLIMKYISQYIFFIFMFKQTRFQNIFKMNIPPQIEK